jgi:transposase
MHKKYVVRLTEQERAQLEALIRTGKSAASTIKHANILLKADADGAAWKDEAIAAAFAVHIRTVAGMRERFVEQGLEAALNRKKQERPSQQLLFDGEAEAHLIALSCSEPPPGHARWTLRLLADTVVEMEMVASTSHETVRRTLKKTH